MDNKILHWYTSFIQEHFIKNKSIHDNINKKTIVLQNNVLRKIQNNKK